MIPWTPLIDWSVWGLSLLGGVGAVLALFKLRYSEKFLPPWSELTNLDSVLPARREELRQVTEAVERCQAEIGQLEGTVGQLRILKEWQDANPEAPARIQQMMLDLERSKSELAAVQQSLAQNEQRLTEVTQETNRLSQEKGELVRDASLLREKITELEKQRADLDATVRDWEDRQRQLEIKLTHLTTEIQGAEARLADILKQHKQADQERAQAIRERDQARAERDAAKSELDGLQKTFETYKGLLEKLGQQLPQQERETDLTKVLADLEQPVLKLNFSGASTESKEETALEHFREHLESKGLHYPKRVQLAFHTSLKASQINPLVVLAGVSGTGKSALPIAYAEAMGMNSLTLAVQPGWSGPQDLFGFYNYLEGKYKATDFARALAQMSRFTSKDLSGLKIASRKEQILLLLLDEMNLARIEYYFSDFLSRLEQRRGRDIDDDQRRREVSLAVDAGSLTAGAQARFIFPDFNVLFVGTMNEDESTQTLSDKVLDRANVLRFGAPKELKAQSTHVSGNASSKKFLPWATWSQWIERYDGSRFRDKEDLLKQINRELEKVHRPFGHRVYRAILDYLANYPGAATSDSRCRNAFADQIEQKIVPKLRGLDTQDDATNNCLEQLERIINGLEDAELSEAFRQARQQPLFEWFGVKRS